MIENAKATCKFERYPDTTHNRLAEGGRRLTGTARRSLENAPLVTIITVSFNAAKTIDQTFHSIRNQSYRNIEYLVVDGASTDGTANLLHANADLIDYYISEPDEGLYFAMNKGLALAKGDYILFLNADDWYEPDCVQTLVDAKAKSGADFVSGLANYVDEAGNFIRIQPASPLDAAVAFRMPLRHETMLVAAHIYNSIGAYDTTYRINADRAFTAKLHHCGYSHHLVQKPLLNFRTSGVSSVDLKGLFAERERMLQDRFPGLALTALHHLVDLEHIKPDRLLQIARSYYLPDLRRACVDYALDREAQGHAAWQDIDVDAFSPALGSASVINTHRADQRRALQSAPKPKVSIILPIYNGESFLPKCLDSLVQQTMTDFEIICINDKSPDNSQAIIDEYASKDKRIKKRINERNIGHGACRNRGVELAQGQWIFHIDPDDEAPPNALHALVTAAEKYNSDIIRGAFVHNQMMAGQTAKPIRKGLPEGSPPKVDLNLHQNPDLLRSTEGHWSCLYRSAFAKRVPYPEDLKMGQDSIFLTHAYLKARGITLIPDIVYLYNANPNSAMNVFSIRKYIDEIEWRYRSYKALSIAGLNGIADHILCSYWNPVSIENFCTSFSEQDKRNFFGRLAFAFAEADNLDLEKTKSEKIRALFEESLSAFAPGLLRPTRGTPQPKGKLRIAVLSTFDSGGAGLAAVRFVEGLRAWGHDANLFTIFKRTDKDYIWKLPVRSTFHASSFDTNELHKAWSRIGVVTRNAYPSLTARELMSKSGGLIEPTLLRALASHVDVLHLHWVAGMFEYARLTEIAAGNTPVAWTMHDMMPFTGGCHYSEGCEGFKAGCDKCPLLPGQSDIPSRILKNKIDGYTGIKSLHLISPSDWLSNLARKSSAFSARPIDTIPNVFTADGFRPTNRLVARRRLKLPLDRKLLVFGADSLNNRRKGGDFLVESIEYLKRIGRSENVACVFFGASSLEIDIESYSMGHVSDQEKLSLIYAAADVFAFPSREDNAPQTVIEAMLSGAPVVAFPVGNVPELVRHKDTGYIARYGDAADFAEGLTWALNPPSAEEALMRRLKGHLQVSAHNDPETAVARHLALYRSLVAPGDGPLSGQPPATQPQPAEPAA